MPKISEILTFLHDEGIPFAFQGDDGAEVDRFSSLTRYKPGSFAWVKTQGNIPEGFDLTQITLAFVPEDLVGTFQNVIRTPQSKRAFFSTIEHFYGEKDEDRPAIGQFTYISPKVKLGKNVRIGHNCTLDGDINIGDGTVIWNNVVIVGHVDIGKDCDIQSGSIIGYENVAYAEDENNVRSYVKQYGGVKIGDGVYIQCHVRIARGTIDDTVIEDGAIIGDCSSISHNCYIGSNSAMLPYAILCGSVYIGSNTYLSAAAVKNQVTVGENVFAGFGSVIIKDVPPDVEVWGYPARQFPLKRN